MAEIIKNTIWMIDFNNTFAVNPLDNPEIRQSTLTPEGLSRKHLDRLRKPLDEMRPWEWVKPLTAGLDGYKYGPVVAWKRLLNNQGLSLNDQTILLEEIGKHYKIAGKDEDHWSYETTSASRTQTAVEHLSKYIDPYTIRNEEKQGLIHFVQRGDEPVFCTSLLEPNELHFRVILITEGIWPYLDKGNPPAFMRRGRNLSDVNPVAYKCAAYSLKHREVQVRNRQASLEGRNQTLELVGLDDDIPLAEEVSGLLGINMLIPYTEAQAKALGYKPNVRRIGNGELSFNPSLVFDTGLAKLAGIPIRTNNTTFFSLDAAPNPKVTLN